MFGSVSVRALSAALVAVALAASPVAALAAPGSAASSSFRDDQFQGVSCVSGHGCLAVGSEYHGKKTTPLGATRASAGGSWTLHDPPSAPGATTVAFGSDGNGEGLSCVPKPYTCLAVGSYGKFAVQSGYAALWNGKSWKLALPPNPKGGSGPTVNAVSCRSASFCLAVGGWLSNSGGGELDSLLWNGRKWALTPSLPQPKGSTDDQLYGLSCASATSCLAVGSDSVGSVQTPFSESWNGKKWTVRSVPPPAKVKGSLLLGVSCPSTRFCAAVGGSLTDSSGNAALAETWNGTRWTIRLTPAGEQPGGSELFDVQCPSATSCFAVGNLAATWNGQSWRGVRFPVPSDTQLADAVALSCLSARSCTAAGFYDPTTSNNELTAAWNWNGSSVTVQRTPSP
jgi:hypothetical protein